VEYVFVGQQLSFFSLEEMSPKVFDEH
jgi:hypothetical protein